MTTTPFPLSSSPLIVLMAALVCGQSYGRPLDATGKCPLNGKLVPASHPYAGTAQTMLLDPRFHLLHVQHEGDMPRWAAALNSVSGINRAFILGDQKVIVATVCNPSRCEEDRAYIAYSPSTNVWGAGLYLNRKTLELGKAIIPGGAQQVVPDELAAAIICAQNLDWGE